MKQSRNGSNEAESKSIKFVYYDMFHSYLMTWRRTLLQVIKAEERITTELKELQDELDNDENPDLKNYFRKHVSIITRNTEHKRMAWLQMVRHIEKRHQKK